jgi:hypothetical protein
LLRRLEEDLELRELRKKPGESVRVLYGGVFGAFTAIDMQPASYDSLRIVVRKPDGTTHVIITPVSQCSFMISIIVPNAGEPQEKIILGFAEPSPT